MIIKTLTDHLVDKVDFASYQESVNEIHKAIINKTGAGNDFLGWVDYPETYNKEELEQIKKWSNYVRENYDVLIVCGIGGSYLGARAAIEAINGTILKGKPEILFMGQTFDPTYVAECLEYLKDKKFAINVISKSGTTTETSVAFRLLKEYLEKRDGVEFARKSIFATTDANKGALLELCKKEGYVRFVLPDDIGGRYSVQTAVGLFPIACAGIDPEAILKDPPKLEKMPQTQTLRSMSATNMPSSAMRCGPTTRKPLRCSSPTFQASSRSANGGNSFMVKAKAKRRKAFSQTAQPSPLTSIPLASSSKMAALSSSRPLSI